MNIGVAVLASLPHAGEHRFHVTLGAGHRLMHAPERVSCLIVIEFRNRADRPPRGGGMAVLARNIQIPVRAVSTCCLRLRVSRIRYEHHEQCCNQIQHVPRLQHGSPLRIPPIIRH
jgi:hypothetical protein